MKKVFTVSLILSCILSISSQSQDTVGINKKWHENVIRNGSYFKIGASFPMGSYAKDQIFTVFDYPAPGVYNDIIYPSAKLGGTIDIGYLIYLGPAFAGNHLRAGIDATFFSLGFNQTSLPSYPLGETDKWKLSYFFFARNSVPSLR